MHRHVTHNKCYARFAEFRAAVLDFLREQVPRNWHHLCDEVTDNFRVIDPWNFRVLGETGYIIARSLSVSPLSETRLTRSRALWAAGSRYNARPIASIC
jgi:hypothetical protein